MQPIESVDYIIDYYALIGCRQKASPGDIAAAIKKRRVEWHPDTLQRAAPEVLTQASRKNGLFARAEEILLNDTMRAAYDVRLSSFESRLVSTTGNPIFDTARERVCLDELLLGKNEDFSALHAHAKTISGFDENLAKTLGQIYSATPTAELKALYRKQLENEWAYVTILEDSAWSSAGVQNKKIDVPLLQHADQYISVIETEIEQTAQFKIRDSFADRLLAQGAGAPLLLMSGETVEQGLQLMTEELQRARLETIVNRFRTRSQGILNITQRKQALMDALISLTDYEYLQRTPVLTEYCTLLLTKPGFDTTVIGLRVSSAGKSISVDDPAYLGKPASGLRGKKFDENTILVDINAEISQPLAQMVYVAERHFSGTLK